MEKPRVRVRGIYATAVAKVLLDEGLELSDLSKKLKERIGHEGSPEPPHVTVKQSDDNPDQLVIIGFPEETDKVIQTLRKSMPYSVHHLARPNLHSAYVVEVDEECRTKLGEEEVRVKAKECYDGKKLIAEVVRSRVFPTDKLVMEEGFRVIGLYAELVIGRGSGVTFSKHITDLETKMLLMNLAAEVVRRGVKVHWRSSAKKAEPQVLLEELEKLYDEATKIMVKARDADHGTEVYPGERLDVVELTLEDKVILDEIRSKVVPTMPYHHSLKSGGDRMAAAVELGDKIAASSEVKAESVIDYIIDLARDMKYLNIIHKKVDGAEYSLGRARVRGNVDNYLVLERRSKDYGKYDGLDVVKEPGDLMITLVSPFSRYLIHAYYDQYGNEKGIYVNVNTGVEVGEGNGEVHRLGS